MNGSLKRDRLRASSPGSGALHRFPSPGIYQLKLEPGKEGTEELGFF